jgi:hypothetical protein
MARSTFEGPILSGDNRFGALRDVGYAVLEQDCYIDLSNSTLGTAGYSGGSGQFVWGNNIPNLNGTVYTPSSTYSPNGPTVATPTADVTGSGAGQIYRGAVMYLPANSQILDIIVDYPLAITGESGATLSNTSVFVSNALTAAGGTPTYATAVISSSTGVGTAGRLTTTYTGTNLLNMLSTTSDIQNPTLGANPSFLSQIVFTLSITGSANVAVPTGGKLNFIVRYAQSDNNIGNLTTYPYGNLD